MKVSIFMMWVSVFGLSLDCSGADSNSSVSVSKKRERLLAVSDVLLRMDLTISS